MYYLLKKIFQNMDYWLIGAVCLLAAFGMVCIASATHVNLGEGYDMVLKQFLFFASGIGLMIAASIIDYDLFSRYTLPLYLFNLALLIIVLLIGTGRDTSRWIAIGPLTLQPSEFCKIIMIFILSKLLSDHKDRVNELPFLFFILGISAVPTLLILKQPALSAAMVIVAITCILLFLAGLDYTYIRNVLIIAVPLLLFVLWDVSREDPLILDKILKPHQFNRILAFVDPSRDPSLYYQTEKSISAIGSGQLTGNGLFQGTLNQLSYLPEPQNDFIFSVVGEEFGFLGCIAVLGVLLFVVFRCIVIAISARDTFSQYLAAGVAGMFAFQTFVNVGVVTGILPNTGISLPFISYGGSSMWTNMIAIGLVQNICKRSSKSLFEGVS